MAKEFFVNGRKVFCVDCTINTDVCPAIRMLMLLNKKPNESCNMSTPMWDNRSAIVRAKSTNMAALSEAVIEKCMECNIKFR